MSDSVRPHRRQPTSLPRPWDSPGKSTGVGCHFLLQCMKEKSESEVAQSCPTLTTPWTAAYQAPLSMRFSRQEYWSGMPLPSPPKQSTSTQMQINHLTVRFVLRSDALKPRLFRRRYIDLEIKHNQVHPILTVVSLLL